jgi:hypothetical protein
MRLTEGPEIDLPPEEFFSAGHNAVVSSEEEG